ncbi:hypothetical protein HAX54_009352 [Datura stramonium]|uniref:Uncharacterized protein n=1 Tax=Datura stramonium TaxID=4076 RepID=A0ABS8TER9_DATST|nr:hypothetical protein [Datura stramonium]
MQGHPGHGAFVSGGIPSWKHTWTTEEAVVIKLGDGLTTQELIIKVGKSDFPHFDGIELGLGSIRRAEFFSIDNIHLPTLKFSIHFDGLAIEWYQASARSRKMKKEALNRSSSFFKWFRPIDLKDVDGSK